MTLCKVHWQLLVCAIYSWITYSCWDGYTATGSMTESVNADSMEWQDDHDLTGMTVPQADDVTGLPVCSMTDHFSSLWHDD